MFILWYNSSWIIKISWSNKEDIFADFSLLQLIRSCTYIIFIEYPWENTPQLPAINLSLQNGAEVRSRLVSAKNISAKEEYEIISSIIGESKFLANHFISLWESCPNLSNTDLSIQIQVPMTVISIPITISVSCSGEII